MFSGALSNRITGGLPRQEMICLNARMARSDGNEKSTVMPSVSRLKSAMTVNSRSFQPSS